MPISEREQIKGFKTCAKDMRKLGFCKGYTSVPAVVRETVSWTFIDNGGDDHRVENTFEYLWPATPGVDDCCDVCGGTVSLSLTPREEYDRTEGPSPMEIIRRAAEERERDRSMITAAERSAAAQERMAAETAASQAQMRALLERQVAAQERANELKALELGTHNGDEPEQRRPSDVKPRPSRKSTA